MIFDKKPYSYYHIVYVFYKCYFLQKSCSMGSSHFVILKGESDVKSEWVLRHLSVTFITSYGPSSVWFILFAGCHQNFARAATLFDISIFLFLRLVV